MVADCTEVGVEDRPRRRVAAKAALAVPGVDGLSGVWKSASPALPRNSVSSFGVALQWMTIRFIGLMPAGYARANRAGRARNSPKNRPALGGACQSVARLVSAGRKASSAALNRSRVTYRLPCETAIMPSVMCPAASRQLRY